MSRTTLLLVALSSVLATAGQADRVVLDNGRSLEGVVLGVEDGQLRLETGIGELGLPASKVRRIETSRSALEVYRQRANDLGDDLEGWVELAQWAEEYRLSSLAKEAWRRVLDLNDQDSRARTALGYHRVGDRWLDEKEWARHRGWVRFDGVWMPVREAEFEQRRRRLALEELSLERETRRPPPPSKVVFVTPAQSPQATVTYPVAFVSPTLQPHLLRVSKAPNQAPSSRNAASAHRLRERPRKHYGPPSRPHRGRIR